MHRFEAEVWRWDGDAAWHFVTVPDDVSDAIEHASGPVRVGFGSVRVRATIGGTTWATSVFPDKQRQAYLLPVKQAVRRAEGLDAGDRPAVALEVVDHR